MKGIKVLGTPCIYIACVKNICTGLILSRGFLLNLRGASRGRLRISILNKVLADL